MEFKKGKLTVLNFLVCILLIAVSLYFFSIMPDTMNILGWVKFTVGAILFVIGLFRLVNCIPDLETLSGRRLVAALYILTAVVLQVLGFRYMYSLNGSEKGIAVATLMLCASLGLGILIPDDPEIIPSNIRQKSASVILAILLLFAIGLNIRDGFSDGSITVGTLLIIEIVIGIPFILSGKE